MSDTRLLHRTKRGLAERGVGVLARGLAMVFLLCLQAGTLPATSSQEVVWRVVSREEVLEAMRLHGDYDPTATTNGARFQAEVLLHLARQARARDPTGPPLFVGHAEWFEGFLSVTGRTAETAPTYALLAYQHGQDYGVDYRAGHIIQEVVVGRTPELAANVVIWWMKTPDAPDKYSYRDSLSNPRLKVTNKSVITYRLLDLGDIVAYDEIKGLTVRPTSGALGLLFRIIGESSIVWSRMAIAQDGLQVTRAQAKKAFITVTSTVTVYPDGRAEKDVPPDRPDLAALEKRLKEPLELEYMPFAWFSDASGGLLAHRSQAQHPAPKTTRIPHP